MMASRGPWGLGVRDAQPGCSRACGSGPLARPRRLLPRAAARDDAEASTKGAERRRQRLLQYVRDAEPAAVLEEFLIKESPVVVGAMRQTISNMLGTITATPQFFTVTISTVGENLAMLMNSVMLTGYMFKSAEERYRLRNALGGGSLAGGRGGGGGLGGGSGGSALPATPAARQQQLRSGGNSSSGSGGNSSGRGRRRPLRFRPALRPGRPPPGPAQAHHSRRVLARGLARARSRP